MRPDLLEGPGPDEEDSGLHHGESRRRMGNEELKRGGDYETDLEKGRKKDKEKKQNGKLLSVSE